jgi:hypothetical protein
MATTTATKVKHSITLSEELSDAYSERAAKLGITPEAEMAARLKKCQEHTAQQGVYLNDEQRQRLSQLTGKLMATPADILAHVEHTAVIRVGDINIPLDGQLLVRLNTRTFGRPFDQMLKEEVVKALETFVGLR